MTMTEPRTTFPTLPRKLRPKRRRIASLIAYDGARFHGFQRQPAQRTVEGEIVQALIAMGLTGGLAFASRTDTGVHARGQVVCFNVEAQASLAEVTDGLKARLPSDIEVRRLTWAPPKFHPRWTATGKRYTYTLRWANEAAGSPFDRVWELPPTADPSALHDAVTELKEASELTGFTAAGAPQRVMPPLTRAELRPLEDGVCLTFEGPAFARYAIRHMVGCAVAQSQRLVPPGTCAATALKQPPYVGLRAPPGGLVLEEVFYPSELDPFGRGFSGPAPVLPEQS